MGQPPHQLKNVARDFDSWARVKALLIRRSPEQQREILRHLGLEQSFAEVSKSWKQSLYEAVNNDDIESIAHLGWFFGQELERRKNQGEGEFAHALTLYTAPADFRHELGAEAAPVPESAPAMEETMFVHPSSPSDATPFQTQLSPPRKQGATGSFAELVAAPGKAVPVPEAQQERTAAAAVSAASVNAAEAVAEWSVETYARLSAELADDPDDADAIWKRYGVGSPRLRSFTQNMWRKRLGEDGELRQRWNELVKEYRRS